MNRRLAAVASIGPVVICGQVLTTGWYELMAIRLLTLTREPVVQPRLRPVG